MKETAVQKFGAHICTKDEWDKLYPSKSELDKTSIYIIKDSQSLLCFDTEDKDGKPVDFRIYGPDHNGPHRRIEFGFYPCTHEQEDPALKSETAKLSKIYQLDKEGKKTGKFDLSISGERCAVDLTNIDAIKARQEEFYNYLGYSAAMIVSNKSSFDLAKFGDESITR